MNKNEVYEIEYKKIDYLFKNLPTALVGMIGLLIFIFAIYYSNVDSQNLFTWVFLNIFIAFVRILFFLSYKRAEININNLKKYYYLFSFFAILSALAWGSSAYLIFPESGEYEVVLLLLTAGVMSASVITFASKSKLFSLYIFFILAPYIYFFISSDSNLYHTFAYIMLFFAVMIFSISKKTSKYVEDNILFEYENGVLVTKLQEKVIDADSANRAKSEFLSVMSHEIRTPLNAIIGFVKILKDREYDVEKQKYLSIIDKSSNILINVINDILDITKIEANKLFLENISFQPKEEFESLYLLFEKTAEESGVRLLNDISPDLPYCMKSDVLRIKQVVSNLLSNAIKFTPEGGEVKLSIFLDEDEKLHIGVKDSGIGIASKDIKKITDSFTQADSSTARKYGGTGLGLSIVTAILKLFDSELMIESKVNEGSNFYFCIAVTVEDVVETLEDDTIEDADFHGKKILVAEDNKTNQMLIEMLLEDMNLEVVIANDGLEALQMIKEEKFDLILMDINMPNMNGIESMQAIQKYEKENTKEPTPLIALTANAVSGDKEKYLLLGFNDYLAKPIDVNLLESILYKNFCS